jgi:hypothetical protein
MLITSSFARDELTNGQDVFSLNMTASHNHEFNYQTVVKEFNEGICLHFV